MKKLSILFTALSLLFLMSCGGEGTKKADDSTAVKEEAQEQAAPEANDVAEAADYSAGEAIYTGKGICSTCHQLTGEGVAPAFPPLANADYLLADKTRAIKQTIYGSKTPITVNGVEYPGGAMTVVDLTDQEVADVVNYILNSWGNNGGTVTVDDVKAARE